MEYHYRAVDPGGKMTAGVLAAGGLPELRETLHGRGLILLEAGPVRAARKRRLSQAGRYLFTQQLAELLAAGVHLDRALEIMGDLHQGTGLAGLIDSIRQEIRGGSSLSAALEKKGGFNAFYLSLVQAGEAAGNLEQVLQRLASVLLQERETRGNLRAALTYPAILVFFILVVLVLALGVIVPKFAGPLSAMGTPLPAQTRAVLAMSRWFTAWWWTLALALAAGGVGLLGYSFTEQGRRMLARVRLGLPVVGRMLRDWQAVQIFRTLGLLLQSGTPLVKGLEISSAGVRDPLWKEALGGIREQIRDGGSFSRAVREARIFPIMALHLAAVGEETGHLESTLQKAADLLDAEARRNIKEKMALLEPVMVLAMAGVVALLIFTVLVPILTFTSQLPI